MKCARSYDVISAGFMKSQAVYLHSVLLKLLRLNCGEGWEGTKRLCFESDDYGNSGESILGYNKAVLSVSSASTWRL